MKIGSSLIAVIILLGSFSSIIIFNVDSPKKVGYTLQANSEKTFPNDYGTRSPPNEVPTFVDLYFHDGYNMNTTASSNVPTYIDGNTFDFILQDLLINDFTIENPLPGFPMATKVYLSGFGSVDITVREGLGGPIIGSTSYGPFSFGGIPQLQSIDIPFSSGTNYTFAEGQQIVVRFAFDSNGYLHYDSTSAPSRLQLFGTPVTDISVFTYNFFSEPIDIFYPNNIDFPYNRRQVKIGGIVTDVFGKWDKKYIDLVRVKIEGPGGFDQIQNASWDGNTNEYGYTWNYFLGQTSGEYSITTHVFDEQGNEFTVQGSFNMSEYGVLLTSPSQIPEEGVYKSEAKQNIGENSTTTYEINVWNIGNYETGMNISTTGQLGWDWWLSGINLTINNNKTGVIDNVPVGGKKGIEFTVNSQDNPIGSRGTILITASCSNESMEDNTLTTKTTVIIDEPPEIGDVSITPSPQYDNKKVNISVMVLDDLGIQGVWINISDPNSDFLGNFSMIQNPLDDSYYMNSSYPNPGLYSFTIWVRDTSDNWDHSGGHSFLILEILKPMISNISAHPNPQEIDAPVNITCDVVSDVGLSGVWINLSLPDGDYLNISMINSMGSKWYSNMGYSKLGTYEYTIWACDASDNWNSTQPSTHQFMIHDTIKPIISNIRVDPDFQEIGSPVNVTCNITDNVEISEVWINITSPEGESLNISMMNGTGNEWYNNNKYTKLGTHEFVIWANDTQGNWNSTHPMQLHFIIQDTTKPEILSSAASTKIELGDNVNITVKVKDNVGVEGVWVQIIGPDDCEVENVSMTRIGLSDDYFIDKLYSEPGAYRYIIYGKDQSDNWASEDKNFIIKDTNAPLAVAGPDQDILQGVIVSLNGGFSSDIHRVENYTWTFEYDRDHKTFYGSTFAFKFEVIGNYSVTLLVEDPSGNSAGDLLWVNVSGVDSDNDGLTDYDEEHIHYTEPLNPDTDGDGVNDGEEIAQDTDPLIYDRPKTSGISFFEKFWWVLLVIIIIVIFCGTFIYMWFKKKGK